MEQWRLASPQSPPDSPPTTSDTLRQVVILCLEGMACRGADTLNVHLACQEDDAPHFQHKSLNVISPDVCLKVGLLV